METYIEGKETPFLISALVLMQRIHGHVSGKMYDEAMEKHPEYFQEELQRRKEYNAIPKEVHKAYANDMSNLFQKEFEDSKPGGLIYWLDHPEEYKEWSTRYWEHQPKRERQEQEIWDKHYSPYNFKRHGKEKS